MTRALVSPSQYAAFNRWAWDQLTPLQRFALTSSGHFHRRADQVLPGDYEIALIVGARGWGKSALAAWEVNGLVDKHGGRGNVVALCAQDEQRTYTTCVEWLIKTAPPWNPCWLQGEVLHWENNTVGYLYSPHEPSKPRGLSAILTWASEISFWPKTTGLQTFRNLKTATRRGCRRVIADTSPSIRSEVLHHLLTLHDRDPLKHPMLGGTMHANILFGESYIQSEHLSYRGNQLRQEVYGELVQESDDAAFEQGWFDAHRVNTAPKLDAIVIGVDPNKAGASSSSSDKTGFVVAGRAGNGDVYTLRDRSDRFDPEDFALAVVDEHRLGASLIVIESNAGGDWVRGILKPYLQMHGVTLEPLPTGAATPKHNPRVLHYKVVHFHRGASESKLARLQGPALAARGGRLKFAGVFDDLENQACTYGGEGPSPDNLDAWCHAVSELLGVNSNAPVPKTDSQRKRELDFYEHARAEMRHATSRAQTRDLFGGGGSGVNRIDSSTYSGGSCSGGRSAQSWAVRKRDRSIL